jgi:transcriptional regulator with XRE-family HTH domain
LPEKGDFFMENAVMNKAIDFENINLEDMKVGGSNDETFGEALTRYMLQTDIDKKRLEQITGISEKTIQRYRSDKNLPDIESIVKICVALNLHIRRSLHLLRLGGCCLTNSEQHNVYMFFLCMAYCSDLTVNKCNEILLNKGLETLDSKITI